jgi:hypothetical protein
VRTFLVLAFIAAAAAAGIYCARKPTIAKGSVIAADLVSQNKLRGWKSMECDENIEIGSDGAKFQCAVLLTDGDRARLGLTLTKQGAYMMAILEAPHPEHGHVPPKADPWE